MTSEAKTTIVALRAELAARPVDADVHHRLAQALLEDDPSAAVVHANEALVHSSLEAEGVEDVVITLARALSAAKMFAEVLELATACMERFPRSTEIFYQQAISFRELGKKVEMVSALERCLALGEDSKGRGTPGSGTFLPLFHLGQFAESCGNPETARSFYQRAMPFPQAAERLSALAKPAKKRPLTIVVCIPGREFSGRFFDAWNEFSEKARALGVQIIVSRRYDAVVYYARNKVAGGDVRRGAKQAPWGGEIDYDYMLWIDSDVVFRFEDFQALLAHKIDMVAGLYLMVDNARYAAVEHMDEKLFEQQGEFDFLTPAKLADRSGLVPVDYCGFGFVLVRRGVFERLEYPWFRPLYFEIGSCSDFTSEDVGFCMMAKRAGIQMMVDPNVVVGHEKAVVLAPPRKAA